VGSTCLTPPFDKLRQDSQATIAENKHLGEGRDPLLPWAPAFAGVAGFDMSDGAPLPDESCE